MSSIEMKKKMRAKTHWNASRISLGRSLVLYSKCILISWNSINVWTGKSWTLSQFVPKARSSQFPVFPWFKTHICSDEENKNRGAKLINTVNIFFLPLPTIPPSQWGCWCLMVHIAPTILQLVIYQWQHMASHRQKFRPEYYTPSFNMEQADISEENA